MPQTPDSSSSPNSDSQVTLKLPLDPPSRTGATEAHAVSDSDPVPRDPGELGECPGHEPPVADPVDVHPSSTGDPASTDSPAPTEPSMPTEPPALPEPPTVGEIVGSPHDAEPGTTRCASTDVTDAQAADVRSTSMIPGKQ